MVYSELRKLGLTKYEIQVYRTLLEYGRITAKTISEYSEVPPTAVYPNLKSLIQKGFVQKLDGETGLFESIKPVLAIKDYISKKKKEMDAISKEIINELEDSIGTKNLDKEKPILSMSHGTDASVEITKNFIKTVKKSFFIIGWRFRKPGLGKISLDSLKDLRKKGIDFRIIVTGKEHKFKEMIQEMVRSEIPMKYYDVDNFSIMIKDAKECKISFKNLESNQRVSLRICDKDLSSFLNNYFLSLWDKSDNINKII